MATVVPGRLWRARLGLQQRWCPSSSLYSSTSVHFSFRWAQKAVAASSHLLICYNPTFDFTRTGIKSPVGQNTQPGMRLLERQ